MNALRDGWLRIGMGMTLAAFSAMPAGAETPSRTETPKSTESAQRTEEQKTLYALGVLINRNLENFQLTPAEFNLVKSGLIDAYNHHADQVDVMVEGPKVKALEHQRADVLTKKLQEQGDVYRDKAAALPGAQKLASGLILIPVHAGSGASPGKDDRVTVNYEGKLVDGTVFDSSIKRGEPATFSVSGVIPCWSEALQLMKVGDKSRVVCPPNLAYGVRGSPPLIRPNSTLDFEVELLGVAAAPGVSAAPAAAPPAASNGAMSR